MHFDDFSTHVRALLAVEFTSRDRDIQSSVTEVRQTMNARGVLNSTMTIQSLAEFYVAEFQARLDLIADHTIAALRSDGALHAGGANVPAGLTLFRSLAASQLEQIRSAYDESVKPVVATLKSSMPDQIRDDLDRRLNSHVQKRDLAIQLEYRLSEGAPKEVLTLRPAIYGVGVDLKELWKRFFG
jgi:hypothetical protein